ncbi:hypothetical protein O9K51_06107 [Purpureocillium lavendulum]|uniref:Uncharacterized protein n=1 Tax=Purpureocillium lavendulum TaxID=1247861 RepID=A0AB34FME6_9HYPO|nr:hypothetical protein O9K51_06107 [Purpureocillium lavendulum]
MAGRRREQFMQDMTGPHGWLMEHPDDASKDSTSFNWEMNEQAISLGTRMLAQAWHCDDIQPFVEPNCRFCS